MDVLHAGLIVLLNGVADAAGRLVSPWSIAAMLLIAALSWLARLEFDELDRQSIKPDVGMH